jgi:peptide/nickel transport system permease protein
VNEHRSRHFWLLASPSGAIGLALLILLLVCAIAGPELAGPAATRIDVAIAGQTPSGAHPLGTNALGQDIMSRVLVASRLSLELAVAATVISTGLGLLLGALPSLFGTALGRFVDGVIRVTVAFPGLLLVLFLAVVFGVTTYGALLAVGLAGVPYMARLARSLIRSLENREFVAAARIAGVRRSKVLTRHILPNVAEPLIINATMTAGSAVLAFAGLSFLGIGIQAPSYDWGQLLQTGQSQLYTNPAAILGPGAAVVAAGLAFNLLGDAAARHLSGGTRAVRSERRREDVTPATGRRSAAASNDGQPLVSVRNLRVTYQGRSGAIRALRGVDLDIRPGESVGLVGESGSGKSAIGLAVAGLVDAKGTVGADVLSYSGKNLLTLSNQAKRKLLSLDLAVVFQDPMSALNPVRRMGSQLTDGVRYHRRLRRRAAYRLLQGKFAHVGIADPDARLRHYPHQFSGGMRQRAVLAMGILDTPSLIIADEPTTALDVTTEARVLALLRSIRDEHRAALLIISHDMSVIRRTTDRVLVVYAGRVIETLPTAELASRAAHPYTSALLSAIPDIDGDRTKPLAVIAGRPPDPTLDIPGCAYAPRCPLVSERCRHEAPVLAPAGNDHQVACWNHANVQQGGAELPARKAGYPVG